MRRVAAHERPGYVARITGRPLKLRSIRRTCCSVRLSLRTDGVVDSRIHWSHSDDHIACAIDVAHTTTAPPQRRCLVTVPVCIKHQP
jgi:hypothetical protein